jgi:hypothetical protein
MLKKLFFKRRLSMRNKFLGAHSAFGLYFFSALSAYREIFIAHTWHSPKKTCFLKVFKQILGESSACTEKI